MSIYARKKALAVRLALLAEAPGTLTGGKDEKTPWPILKAKLDKAFSELVRLTHSDNGGWCKCVTCPTDGYWKGFDCGHFVDRDQLPTRWDLDNCRPQCQVCNRFKTGRRYEFGRALNAENPGLADQLILKGKGPSEEIRQQAPQMLIEIRAALKIQRRRFK